MSSSKPMTDPVAAVGPADTLDSAEWLRANWVTLTAVLGLVVQLWWRAGMLAHSYFQQSDFPLLYRAAAGKLGLSYLVRPVNGQFAPGGRAVTWLETRAGLYNWGVASAVTLLMLALAGLALWRLLRTLFGNRPAVLVPYALYLVTPLVVPVLTWWSATLAWLPLQIATFMALNAHVCYIRTSRFRHAAAAACWMVAGALFLDKGVLAPLLLLALTSAFFLPGRWTGRPAAVAARILARMAALRGGHGGIPGTRSVAGQRVRLYAPADGARPGPVVRVVAVRVGLVPGLLGGPWRWWSTGSYAAAAQMPVLTAVSWLAAAAAVVASVWFRKRAWRAWVILVAWVAIADLGPVILGWLGAVVTPPLTADLSYLADAVPVIVICTALAFWPARTRRAPTETGCPSGAIRIVIALNVVGVIVLSSLWSAHAYDKAITDKPARSYIATARLALRNAPAGADIFSAPVPTAVMSPALFGDASNTAAVLGPLAPRSARVRWTTSPQGPVHELMIFDGQGRLWPAIVTGVSATAPPRAGTCWPLERALSGFRCSTRCTSGRGSQSSGTPGLPPLWG